MFRRSFISLASFLCTFAFIAQTEAANRYWVGSNDRWESTANWAATSGGGGGQTVPGSSDIAIFDGGGSSDALARSALNVSGLLLASTTSKTLRLGTGSLRVGAGGLRVGAGALKATARPISVAGNITQTGGYILELSTLSVSGNIVISANSTGLYSSGTTIFNGSSNQILSTDGGYFSAITIRNSGSAGNNNVTVDCGGICGFGFFGGRPTFNVERGVADFDTYANRIGILGANLVIGTGSTAASLVTDSNIILTGSVIVGDNGTLTMSGSSALVFSGTGTMTLDTNSALIPNLILNPNAFTEISSDIGSYDGPAQLILAGNQRVSTAVSVCDACSLSLDTYTLAATGATITNAGTISENTGKIVHAASNLANKDSSYATTVTEVGIGNRLYITIDESDANLDGTSPNTLSVTLTTAEGDSETLTLTETGNATGVFRSSIGTAQDKSVYTGDSVLQLLGSSTTVTITYTDPQDGLSNSASVTLSTSSSGSSSSTSTTHTGGGGGRRVTTTSGQSSSQSSSAFSTSSASSSSGMFNDVPSCSWFFSFVEKLTSMGIVSGYKDNNGNPLHEFRPVNNVTYAEIAKMTTEAAGLSPLSGASMNTSDDGQWSEGYVHLMESKGITAFKNHALDVNSPAPRGAVVQILLETFHVTLSATENPYSDVPSSSSFAKAILQATHDGIVSGDDPASSSTSPRSFRPNDPVNRAETAKMVLKALEAYGE